MNLRIYLSTIPNAEHNCDIQQPGSPILTRLRCLCGDLSSGRQTPWRSHRLLYIGGAPLWHPIGQLIVVVPFHHTPNEKCLGGCPCLSLDASPGAISLKPRMWGQILIKRPALERGYFLHSSDQTGICMRMPPQRLSSDKSISTANLQISPIMPVQCKAVECTKKRLAIHEPPLTVQAEPKFCEIRKCKFLTKCARLKTWLISYVFRSRFLSRNCPVQQEPLREALSKPDRKVEELLL
jgi:hypothetical protein